MSNDNNNNCALSVFEKNPDFAIRLQHQTAEIKKSHKNLSEAAANYTVKYDTEVNEGTKKMQLLLTEGKRRGFTEEEILAAQQNFCPTVRTPILNMLFFLLKEHPDAVDNITFNRIATDLNYKSEQLLTEQNEKYGSWQHDAASEKTADQVPEMDEFIYGEMTHATYQTIKKLKRLSQSPNQAEAFAAYRKCLEMCKKYNLEFDKVKV